MAHRQAVPAVGDTWSMPLKGVRLLYMHETEAAILIGLETESRSVACPACGSASVVGYGKMTWRIRDLPIEKKSVFLEIRRRRLRCRDCLVTFNEPVPNISSNHRATTRLVQRVWKLALRQPFTALSLTFGMDEKTIRNIFNDTFAATAEQFKATTQPPTPAALAIRVPKLLRRQRLMWINLDQGTVIDMEENVTPETMHASLQRITRGEAARVYVPPDAAVIEALAGCAPITLVLHPASIKSACNDLVELGRTIAGAAAYVAAMLQFIRASSETEAMQAWQGLQTPPPGLRSKMRPLLAAVELLPPGSFAAFGEPDHPCDILTEQLEKILNTDYSKRSYDVICAIVLFDKALQKTARIGVARDGVHLSYQKANYGTSIAKLVARLDKSRGADDAD